MVLALEELMSKDKLNLTPFELEVMNAQVSAENIKNQIAESNITLVHGIVHRVDEEIEQANDEMILEIRSMNYGYVALGKALEYLTQEKTVPLNEKQYFALRSYVIEHYPKTMWDHNLWCKRVNKVIREWDIPVDENVQSYTEENDRLHVLNFFQEVDALRSGVDINTVIDKTMTRPIITLWPIHDDNPSFEEFRTKLEKLGYEGDPKELYNLLKEINRSDEKCFCFIYINKTLG